MAKFIPILGQLSGTLSGVVFSHNRNGAYVRARALPINPRTNDQERIRSIFALTAGTWADRTVAQQIAWGAYADTMPLIDSLGQTYFISGFNAYVRGNSFRNYNTLNRKNDAPVLGGQATALAPSSGAILALDSASAAPNSIRLNLTLIPGFPQATDDVVLQVSIGPIIPVGVSFFSTPFHVIGQVLGDAGAPPTIEDIPSALLLVVGQKVPVRLRWADEQARVSPPYQEIITVTNVP